MTFFPRIYAVSECWERGETIDGGRQVQCIIMSAIIITRAAEEAVTKISYEQSQLHGRTRDYRYAGADCINVGFWWIVKAYLGAFI